jgi:hypothetical protein
MKIAPISSEDYQGFIMRCCYMKAKTHKLLDILKPDSVTVQVAGAMTDRTNRVVVCVKAMLPEAKIAHCCIYRESLGTKKVLAEI